MQARHERVLGALLLDGAPSPAVLAEARQLGLAPELRRTPLLLDFAEPADLALARQWLLGQASDAWCLRVHDTRLLWCTPRAVTPALQEQWAAAALKPLRVMLGSPTSEPLELQAQLRQLADLASFAEHKLPQQAWLPLATQRVAAALWRYRDDAGVRILVEPYRALQAEDASGQLRRTLHCWFELDGDAQACAQALSIHRNSLRYRLERIAEVCALDLASPKGMAELYLGMLLAQESAEPD
ncbi:MAG: Carbohydrate diacid regulator [Stenotrophomonas maltophilia]|nr:MAG: Carbohydrate diacid regulator [Stenotrophomonas maltophilia]